jgi:uncharacterized SAM-binding protein YcdF (DUF218 family)
VKRRGIIAGLLFLTWCLIGSLLANFLIVEKPLTRADAIIVLSGSAAYRERTRKAAQLYKQGVAPKIYITDDGQFAGWSEAEQRNPPFYELEKRELISNGVDPDAITVMPGIVAGTDDEARAIADEVHNQPIHSLLIVTSAYHTRRALWTFEKALAGQRVEIGIVSPLPGQQTPTAYVWWIYPSGWSSVAAEYVKSVVYYFYY